MIVAATIPDVVGVRATEVEGGVRVEISTDMNHGVVWNELSERARALLQERAPCGIRVWVEAHNRSAPGETEDPRPDYGRLLTLNDYEQLSVKMPGVKCAKAERVGLAGVRVLVTPLNGTQASCALLSEVYRVLEQFKDMGTGLYVEAAAGYTVTGVTASELTIARAPSSPWPASDYCGVEDEYEHLRLKQEPEARERWKREWNAKLGKWTWREEGAAASPVTISQHHLKRAKSWISRTHEEIVREGESSFTIPWSGGSSVL